MDPDTQSTDRKKTTVINRLKNLFSKKQQRSTTPITTDRSDGFDNDVSVEFTNRNNEQKMPHKYPDDVKQPYPNWMLEEFGKLDQGIPGNKSVVLREKFYGDDVSGGVRGDMGMPGSDTPCKGLVCPDDDPQCQNSHRISSKKGYKLPEGQIDSSQKGGQAANDDEGPEPHATSSDFTISEAADVKVLTTVTEKPELEGDDDFALFPKSSFAYHIGAHDLPTKAIQTPGFPREQPYYSKKKKVQSNIEISDGSPAVQSPSFPTDEPYYVKRKRARSHEIERKKQYSSKKRKILTNNGSPKGVTVSLNDRDKLKDATRLSTPYSSNVESGYIKVICPICPKHDSPGPDLLQSTKSPASPKRSKELSKKGASSQKLYSKVLFFGDGGLNKSIFSLLNTHPPAPLQRYKNTSTSELPLGLNSMSPPGYYRTFDPRRGPYSCPVFTRDNVEVDTKSPSESSMSLESRFSTDQENGQRKDHSGSRTHLSSGGRTPRIPETPSQHDQRRHYKVDGAGNKYMHEGLESASGSSVNEDTENTNSIVDWLVTIAGCFGINTEGAPNSKVDEKHNHSNYHVNRSYPPNDCGEAVVRKPLSKDRGRNKCLASKSNENNSVPQIRSETIQRKCSKTALCKDSQNDCVTSKSSDVLPDTVLRRERSDGLLRKPLSTSSLCKPSGQSGWLPRSKSSVSVPNSHSMSSKCSSLSKSSTSSRSVQKKNQSKRIPAQAKHPCRQHRGTVPGNTSQPGPWVGGERRGGSAADKSTKPNKSCKSGAANKSSIPKEHGGPTKPKDQPRKLFKTPKSKSSNNAGKLIGTETKFDQRSNTEFITLIYTKDND